MRRATSPGIRLGGVCRTVWRLAGPKKRELAFGITLRFVQALLMAVPIGLLTSIIDGIRRDTVSAADVWVAVGIYAVCLLGQLVTGYLAYRYTWVAAFEMMGDLRRDLLDHLRRLPLAFHGGRQAGDTVTVFTQDMAMLELFTHNSLPQIFGAVGAPVLVFLVLLFVDVPMAIATMASVVAGIPVFQWTNSVFKSLALRRQDLQAEATSRMLEYLQGISVVRAFNRSGERLERFRRALDDFRRMNTLLAVRLTPLGSAFMAVVELGVPLVIAAGTYWLLGGRLDAGSLLIFLVLILRVYQPLLQVALQAEPLRLADASLERLARVADAPGRAEPMAPPRLSRFDVAFEHVDFGYEKGVPVLRDVSFAVPAGSMTALVGPSGSGKTTALNLVARFWDADAGTVRIGGVDVRDLATEQIFDAVTIVFQDVYLFQGSVFDNIAFGRRDANRDDVIAAAQAAQAHDFISALPQGYDSLVGEGGARLSGGERQRISIARAILKDSPIVLLDEASASIDPTNERLVQEALARLVRHKTLIVVAHRLSTIRSADQIIALNQGRVVERGVHAELVAAGGLYARFWSERERATRWRIATSTDERGVEPGRESIAGSAGATSRCPRA
jgi:ATP-binding cassette subfamily B protein